MNESLTVAIVGIGKVGKAIAFFTKKAGYKIETIFTNQTATELIKETENILILKEKNWNFTQPDILFITTPDDKIENIAKKLSEFNKDKWQKTLVFHCSGAFNSELLLPLKNLGAKVGSIHPLKSFAQNIISLSELANVYWCVEGDKEAIDFAEKLITFTAGKIVNVRTDKKALYHAAAVMSCGHVLALLDLSLNLLAECGIKPHQAKEILMPLIQGTINNFASQEISEALTGPFARGDFQTISHHLQAMLKLEKNDYLPIYTLLGQHSLKVKNK